MPRSAFGVDHTISKSGPYPGGQWGSNASPEDQKKAKRRFGTAVAAGGTGGALIGGVVGGGKKTKAAGAGLAAAGLGAHLVGTKRDIKRGVIKNPYKKD